RRGAVRRAARAPRPGCCAGLNAVRSPHGREVSGDDLVAEPAAREVHQHHAGAPHRRLAAEGRRAAWVALGTAAVRAAQALEEEPVDARDEEAAAGDGVREGARTGAAGVVDVQVAGLVAVLAFAGAGAVPDAVRA